MKRRAGAPSVPGRFVPVGSEVMWQRTPAPVSSGFLQAMLGMEVGDSGTERPERHLDGALLVDGKLATRDHVGGSFIERGDAYGVRSIEASVDQYRRAGAIAAPARVGEHVIVAAFGHPCADGAVDHARKGTADRRGVAQDILHVAIVDVLLQRQGPAVAGV